MTEESYEQIAARSRAIFGNPNQDHRPASVEGIEKHLDSAAIRRVGPKFVAKRMPFWLITDTSAGYIYHPY